MDPRLAAIAHEHGIFLRREAIELGYDDRTIAALTRSGEWHRVRRGAFAPGKVWSDLTEQGRHATTCRAVLRTVKVPAVLSHMSSLNEYETPLWDLDLSTVHITRPDQKSGRAEAGVRQHSGKLRDIDRVHRKGVEITSATRTGLDVCCLTDVEHGLVVLDGLLHAKLTSISLLRAQEKLMRNWPGSLTLGLVIGLADGRSESVGESRLRYLCWAEGVPAPEPQYKIRNHEGRVIARVDLAWPKRRAYAEFDGRIKYTRLLKPGESVVDVVLREKKRESDIYRTSGYRPVRVIWSELYCRTETADRIRQVLESDSWPS